MFVPALAGGNMPGVLQAAFVLLLHTMLKSMISSFLQCDDDIVDALDVLMAVFMDISTCANG